MVAVVHENLPHAVTFGEPYRIETATCSCGGSATGEACSNAGAVGLRLLRACPAFDTATLERWERTVRALAPLAERWDELASTWIDTR